ncbi:zinc finger domain-containing protein [Thermochaetoides thermophila DSM 1495]|uniref:Zinc finger domain-containing protein n=1 Tax=Chaetomium thermophilum (strain DSM 1495 / CBS 144.50 / IMI 039719) TaxID=759272 RepID=G0S7M0_CHATD|nr:zinc finger domain-containing protein [Thermochaetoides thermophila DSM 1495]EGS21811.1 zinc finger domain-containing protein [Thermochaetoides thermophila DSM 1495]
MARSNSDEATSYVKMPQAELDSRGTDASLVGSHCQYPPCNQLDFLPFRCQSCNKVFCLEHRTEDGHQCTNKGAWAERRRQAELARRGAGEGKRMRDFISQKPCAHDGCKTIIGTSLVPGVHCQECNRDYCMKHRLKEDHDCAKKPPIGARGASAAQAAAVAEGAKSALERLKLWSQAKKEKLASFGSSSSSKAKVEQMVAVNNLKKTAKGDAKIPPEKRIYLYVEAEATTAKAKVPKGEFFYNQDWVVGKMLDAAAKSLQVQNVNNQSDKEEDRLRVFHVEGGRLLDFNEKLGTAVQSGNTVVLLRGVGPPPELIDL